MKNQTTATAGKFLFPILLLLQFSLTKSFAQTLPNANHFSAYLPYEEHYRYGMNPGYYGGNWSTQNIVALSIGDPAAGVGGMGAKSFRVPLYDDFLTTYGITNLLGDYQYMTGLGAGEITAFIGHPHPSHQLDTTFPGSPEKSKVFAGMYEPIWLDAAHTQVNPANTFAKYLFDVVKTYGQYVKFWEVVNEPDFTYSPAGWYGDAKPVIPGSWFDHNPTPAELENFRAPIFYYIRMLRVSWEVIKTLSPQSYVCTGGIGYKSFLDALLRNTDNPVDGSVSADFPEKAGAYFDILSFHNYPMFQLKYWDAASGTTKYNRHSDAAVNAFLDVRSNMDSILKLYGYDGNTYPRKQYICTETGVSRIMGGQDWGSNEGQKNYMIKAQVAAQKSGIKQTYWFQLGDGPSPTEQFDQMGLYNYFGQDKPYAVKPTDQGIALKTTSGLLYGKTFDPIQTDSLHLPSTVDGGAFKGTDGNFVYVLWAKTTTDLSESVSANYSFPRNLGQGNVVRMEWNYADADTSSIIPGNNIVLTASPSFFTPTLAAVNQNPSVNAGGDLVIRTKTDSLQLKGTAVDPDGTVTTYQWTKITGPLQYSIAAPGQAVTEIRNLVTGVYTFRLTATDDKGGIGVADVHITVPVVLPAHIEAESYTAMSGVQTENAWGDPLGGGLHVGWIDQGDWMDYVFYAPAGSYKINMRIASAQDGAQFQFKKQDGTVIKTINVPNTGGWQTWQTISDTLSLSDGLQTIRLQSTAVSNWNINWFEFLTDTTTRIDTISKVNQPPLVNAGTNQTITLPTNSLTLAGSASDSDGTIASYQWTKIAGGTATIGSPATAATTVSGLAQGTYTFRLTATDNSGATAFADMNVTVNAAPNRPPVVNAGTNQTITLPTSSLALAGSASDSDGTIASYQWTKIAGGNATIGSPASAATSVSGLTQGTYTFRLTATDNSGASAFADMTVTVKPNPSIHIEAETYTNMSGVQTQPTLDSAGGLEVTGISNNDWMDYTVNVSTAGSYTVNFRLACTKPGTRIQLKKADGTVLATVNVPNTGGPEVWQTLSVSLTLGAGQQTFRIFASKVTGILNCNWWELIPAGSTNAGTVSPSATKPMMDPSIDGSKISADSPLWFYPSPVHTQFQLVVNHPYTGTLKVQIISMSGTILREFALPKTEAQLHASLSISDLQRGGYILRASLKDWVQSGLLLKQ
ncbi:MAG: PKD domain-containing protein [Flavisolibacter sp.]